MIKEIISYFRGGSRSLENPNTTLNDWFDSYSAKSDAGERVSEQTLLRIPAFWQGVTLLSGDVAKIPLEIYRRVGAKGRTVDTSHPAYNVVRWRANEDQSAYDFWVQMMCSKIIWNNAYAYIERNARGEVQGMYPLLPDRTSCSRVDGRKIYTTEVDGKRIHFNAFDIFHLKGISFDGDEGLRLASYMRDVVGKILARDKFASKFFSRGGRVGGILEIPVQKNKTIMDKIEQGFRKSYEDVDSAFKTVILRENAKFHAAQASFKDTQLIEVAREDVRVVARILNIPPHKLADGGNSAHNSLEQENRAYADSSLGPHLCNIASECWLKLLNRETRQASTRFFEHTIGALLWADSKTVSEIGSKGVMAGWLTRNEVRHWFNFNSVEGGDELLIPSGMTKDTDEETEPEAPTPEPVAETPPEMEPAAEDAVRAILKQTQDRFRGRITKQVEKQKRSGSVDWGTIANHNLPIGKIMFEDIRKLLGTKTNYEQMIIDELEKENSNGIIRTPV